MRNKGEGSATKCLMVLETVSRSPSITRDQIAADLGLNRSAVYRAIRTLASRGYVRPTLCGTRYRIAEQAEDVFGSVSMAHKDADKIALETAKVVKEFSLHADIALIERPGVILNFETTDRMKSLSNTPLSLAWSSLAWAALAEMSSNQRQRHIQSYLLRATNAEVAELHSPDFAERLDEIRVIGGVIDESGSGITQAILNRETDQIVGAVRFRHYVNATRNCNGCTTCIVSEQIRGSGGLKLTHFRTVGVDTKHLKIVGEGQSC